MATDRFNHPYFSNWDVHLFDDAPVGRQQPVQWARLVLGFHTGVLIFALLIGQPILIFRHFPTSLHRQLDLVFHRCPDALWASQ